MPKSPLIFYGILNPKGEDDDKLTTYFTESELVELSEKINNEGLPLFIDHVVRNSNGDPVDPSGEVHLAFIHPQNKMLYIGASLFSNKNGKYAMELMFDKKNPMREFSLGYDITLYTLKSNPDISYPVHKEGLEVSICFKGARQGTKILGFILKDDENNIKIRQDKNYQHDDFIMNKIKDLIPKNINQYSYIKVSSLASKSLKTTKYINKNLKYIDNDLSKTVKNIWSMADKIRSVGYINTNNNDNISKPYFFNIEEHSKEDISLLDIFVPKKKKRIV